jgi:DNA ligase-1
MKTLYHKAKGGDLRQWRVWTEGADILTEYGQVGGALQTSRKRAEGKNIGRSNETSPEEQAKLEAAALWKFKVERKYSETMSDAQEELFLPMLAHTFKGKLDYPCDVQPKLDGVRCLASRDDKGRIQLTSRQGKPWNIPSISIELDQWLPQDAILDGEVYIHGESCQRITSLAKSADPDGKSFKSDSHLLEYHVYDIPVYQGNDTLPWVERYKILSKMSKDNGIVPVLGQRVTSEKELWGAHDSFVQDGYEGAVIRLHHGLYLWGYRSHELLKVKKFQDEEFTVVDARDGRGKMAGKVVWVCRNNIIALSDNTFECSMKVSMEEREEMFKNRAAYLGKKLTVRFFDRTDEGTPRFPVGIVFRDEKDLPIEKDE